MQENKRKDPTIRFLKRSFVGLLLFSITTFMILGIYMNRKSEKAVYDVGEIYMSGMNRQMAKHFETVINLRFSQLEGIVSLCRRKMRIYMKSLITGRRSEILVIWRFAQQKENSRLIMERRSRL